MKTTYLALGLSLTIALTGLAGTADAGEAAGSPTAERSFRSVRVGGVRLISESDSENEVRPFNYDQGYYLSLIGELPGKALALKEGKLSKAIADNGENLLPAEEYRRFLEFQTLSKDKKLALFQVGLNLPGKEVKGIKELSGEVVCLVSTETEKISLGELELKAGAKGENLGAEIARVSNQGQESELEINMKVSLDEIKALSFVDPNGEELKVSQVGYCQFGEDLTLNYYSEEPLPAKAKIVVERYINIKEYVVTFSLNNITLLGEPK
ncbi:MAG: hypothetical protein JXA52_08040 [Planctomycetes bacterium]|nr:hypothetical protein [Planctomycetota bacterium]